MRQVVVETIGDEKTGVLIVDETGFLKKGSKSAGVARQYSGTAGRIENSQVGVFLAYASDRGRALIDRELYLPKSWTEDRDRCRDAGIDDSKEFATKPELAQSMIERAVDGGIPFGWVTADEAYGQVGRLRMWLESRGVAHVLAVPKSQMVISMQLRQRRAHAVIAELEPSAWQRLSCGDGAHGPRVYDWAAAPIRPLREPARSRHTISTSGRPRSHVATVSAVRSGNRSIGVRVVMSMTTAEVAVSPAEREVVDTQNGHLLDGPVGDRPHRPQHGVAADRDWRAGSARRAPARPATASPIASIMAAAAGVRRLHGSVKPEICSAKVFAAQSVVSQKNRRIRMSIRTGYPPIAVSASCRRYRECTRRASPAQRGHDARSPRGRASMRITDPTRRTSRTSKLSKCGSKPLPPSSAHPKDPQLPTSVQFSDTPSAITESPPDPRLPVP